MSRLRLSQLYLQKAFTLVELLVTIAVLGILAGLLLPALSRAKDKAMQTACSNNLRQMAIAFQLYLQEHGDEFPTPGSKTDYGPQPEDWIWWQQNRDVRRSAIARYISSFNPAIFTCPADRGAKQLQQRKGTIDGDPYRYSYSLTSYNLTSDNVNPGMSTIITQIRKVYPFRASQIKHPSAKIMLVEESRKTSNDSRWVPVQHLESAKKKYNFITSRHGGRGNVIFADTHAQAVMPEFGQDPTNSRPSF